MPTRDSAPIGAPCWVDLMTSDPGRSRDFYSQLFGWAAEDGDPQFGGYFNFSKDGSWIAGGMPRGDDHSRPEVWSIYLCTDDAQKTVDAASDNGAQVIVPPMPVGDLGTMFFLVDPGGAAIGGWQPGTHPGFKQYGDYNTPSWFELWTRDYEASLAFYRDVFRWDTEAVSDTPEFRYTLLKSGDEQLAGIMDASAFLPEGVPAHWSVYFGVEDADATLKRIGDLGGATVVGAEDTPYGRLATATDPMGAQFKLVAPNEAMPARS
ncbi:MAG: VOC family protein [Acidimicrobiia bacterium]|nr:VOC family protein [Acidimicrobiia bacterium]